MGVQTEDGVDIQGVRGDETLLTRIAVAFLKPSDVLVASEKRVFAVSTLAGPIGDPVWGILKELGGAIGVGEQDEQFAAVGLLPELEEAVLGGLTLLVGMGHGGEGHGKLVGVGTDGFDVVVIGHVGVGGAGESGAEDVAHGLDDIFLPEKGMAAAGAKVTDLEAGDVAEALHFLPEVGLGAGIEDVQLELGKAF